jgi:predicted RNA-binding protein
MSQGNIILDIRRFEKFEFGSDHWLFHKDLEDWRSIAKWCIYAAEDNRWQDFREGHNIIEDVLHINLNNDCKIFWDWIRGGIFLRHYGGNVKGFDGMEHKIYFGGYVMPCGDEYDIVEKLGYKGKIKEVGSYWFRKDL